MTQFFKIKNFHKKISFEEINKLLGVFGTIDGFLACEDFFIFRFSSLKHNLLDLDHLSLGGKRIKVDKVSYQGELDFKTNSCVLFFPKRDYDVDDIKNECIRYGSVKEVNENERGIEVVCSTEKDAKDIFYNIYGRFYNSKRIRCVFVK